MTVDLQRSKRHRAQVHFAEPYRAVAGCLALVRQFGRSVWSRRGEDLVYQRPKLLPRYGFSMFLIVPDMG